MNLCTSEIEQYRTPKEYTSWFDTVLNRAQSSDFNSRSKALCHCGIYKRIYEELFPLNCLLRVKQDEWKNSKFRNLTGNQNYDVEILNNALAHLEISTASFDDEEVFRMQELLRNGTINANAPVVRNEKGHPVKLDNTNRFHNHDEIADKKIARISERILKKSEKIYPNNTGLVVYFDDYSIWVSEREIDILRRTLSDTQNLWSKTFESVFIIGARATLCIENSV